MVVSLTRTFKKSLKGSSQFVKVLLLQGCGTDWRGDGGYKKKKKTGKCGVLEAQ